jgi:hypothetical protein
VPAARDAHVLHRFAFVILHQGTRKFGPHQENPLARPFGFYKTASHLANELGQKQGGLIKKFASLTPLTEAEKEAGICKTISTHTQTHTHTHTHTHTQVGYISAF